MSDQRLPTGTPPPIPAGSDDLCLAFANTRFWRGSAAPTETLAGCADLLRWLGNGAILPAGTAAGWADLDPAQAEAVFSEAIALRETVYRIFAAVAAAAPVAGADLATLNRALADAPLRTRLAAAPEWFGWSAPGLPFSAPALLAPVIWSAADLLTRTQRRRIRRCANDQCLWLFIDESRTGTRRWCDMAACGNRAKARRHYLRTKAG